MARGGKRPNAGRKPGSATKKTRDIANRAASEGITPLEVMLQAMRAHYDAGNLDEAALKAKDAAPYVHPKLASVDNTLKGDEGPLQVVIKQYKLDGD
jgi:hypothetical protein